MLVFIFNIFTSLKKVRIYYAVRQENGEFYFLMGLIIVKSLYVSTFFKFFFTSFKKIKN